MFDSAVFDSGTFDTGAEAAVTDLHGRRVRGKRIFFPDEFDPQPEVKAPQSPETVLDVVAAEVERTRIELRQAEQNKARARTITRLKRAYDAALADHEAARKRRQIQRLRQDDEFLLLAA